MTLCQISGSVPKLWLFVGHYEMDLIIHLDLKYLHNVDVKNVTWDAYKTHHKTVQKFATWQEQEPGLKNYILLLWHMQKLPA